MKIYYVVWEQSDRLDLYYILQCSLFNFTRLENKVEIHKEKKFFAAYFTDIIFLTFIPERK